MKTKMKSVLLTVIGFVFALCLAVVCGLGFKPAYTVSANTASTLKMEDGAQVRLVANDPGLRFTASISWDEYNTVKSAGGTFGMFILPNAYREDVGEIEEATAFGANAVYCWDSAVEGKKQIIRCTTDNLTQTSADGNTVYFACALTNIKPTNYEVDFYATVYYEVNGERVWAEANAENVRSISYVAQKVLGYENAGTYTPTAAGKTALVNYVTQFEEAGETAGEASLYVADLASVVKVALNGEEIDINYSDDLTQLQFSNLTTGRYTATITLEDESTWDVPFVYATMVIDEAADFARMNALWTENGVTVSDQYFVVANDITFVSGDAYYRMPGESCKSTNCTFDGYGHTISNMMVNGNRWGLFGNTMTTSTVKDVAFVNVFVNASASGTVICGTMSASTIENVFISGYAAQNGTNVYLMAGRCSVNSTIKNCVVIDNSYAEKGVTLNKLNSAALTRMTSNDTTGKISDTVVYTGGHAVANNASSTVDLMTNGDTRCTGCEKVGLNDSDSLITALTTLAAKENNFSFDATTNTLSLCGNAVYTVVTE